MSKTSHVKYLHILSLLHNHIILDTKVDYREPQILSSVLFETMMLLLSLRWIIVQLCVYKRGGGKKGKTGLDPDYF
jgi:hypothetical protein